MSVHVTCESLQQLDLLLDEELVQHGEVLQAGGAARGQVGRCLVTSNRGGATIVAGLLQDGRSCIQENDCDLIPKSKS